MMQVFKFITLVFVACCMGCGYTFQGGGSVLPEDVKNVYIPLVQNNTSELGLSQLVTEALRDRFERYGVLFVVDDLQDADAVLNAKILNLRRETRTSTATTDTALQFDSELTITADLVRVTGQTLWRGGRIASSKTFGTSSSVVVTSSVDFLGSSLNTNDLNQLDTRELSRGQEQEILEDLAENVAQKVYNQAVLPDF
ncbi:MAG: hypothetical protein KDD62_02220 [Bdellovibrionales bacterium]|nr:hypothetical protein [Bdellovibrionales bacterium]